MRVHDDNTTDQLFREALGGYTITPSAHVWEGVQAAQRQRRGRFWPFLATAAAAMVVLGVSITVYLYHGQTAAPGTVVPALAEIPVQAPEATPQPQEPAIATIPPSDASDAGNVAANEPAEPAQATLMAASQPEKAQVLPMEATEIAATEATAERVAPAGPITPQELRMPELLAAMPEVAPQHEEVMTVDGPKPRFRMATWKTYVGASAGVSFSRVEPSLSEVTYQDPLYLNTPQQVAAPTVYGTSTAALQVGVKSPGGVRFETGLRKVHFAMTTAQITSAGNWPVPVGTTADMPTYWVWSDNLSAETDNLVPSNPVTYEVEYVQVPVKMAYDFDFGRWSLYAGGGAGFNFMTSESQQEAVSFAIAASPRLAAATTEPKRMAMSAELEAGVAYSVIPKVQVFVQPSVSSFLNKLDLPEQVNQAKSARLETGLRVQI